jgi:hypothetical protein
MNLLEQNEYFRTQCKPEYLRRPLSPAAEEIFATLAQEAKEIYDLRRAVMPLT